MVDMVDMGMARVPALCILINGYHDRIRTFLNFLDSKIFGFVFMFDVKPLATMMTHASCEIMQQINATRSKKLLD